MRIFKEHIFSLYSFCALAIAFNTANSFACSDPPCKPTPEPQSKLSLVKVSEKIIGLQNLQQSEATLYTAYQQKVH